MYFVPPSLPVLPSLEVCLKVSYFPILFCFKPLTHQAEGQPLVLDWLSSATCSLNGLSLAASWLILHVESAAEAVDFRELSD